MARLAFGGFDLGHFHADGITAATNTGAAPTIDSSIFRSGSGSMKAPVVSGVLCNGNWLMPLTSVAGRAYYLRAWVYLDAYPSGASTDVIAFTSGSTIIAATRINTDGTVQLSAGTVTPSPALSLNTWHCLEVKIVPYGVGGTGANQGSWASFRVDGTEYGTLRNVFSLNTLPSQLRFGNISSRTWTGNFNVYIDDWALNDDVGSSDVSWPGASEKTLAILPNADGTIGSNVRLGDNTSPTVTNPAYETQNNVPPVGAALGSGSKTNQLRYAVVPTGGPNDTHTLSFPSYSAAGVPAGATVNHVQWAMEISSQGGIQTLGAALSNPSVAETNLTTSSNAVAYPSSWDRRSAITSAPSVALGTSPTITNRWITQNQATGAPLICSTALYVTYTPSSGQNVDLGGAATTTVAGGLLPTPGSLSQTLGGATTTTEAHGLAPAPGTLAVSLGKAETTTLAGGLAATPGSLNSTLGAATVSISAGGLQPIGASSNVQLGHATLPVDAAGLSLTPGVKNTTLGSANPVFFAAGILVSTGPRNVLLGQALATFFAHPFLVTFPRKRPGHLGLNPAGHYRSTGAGHYELHPPGEVRYDD